LIIKNELAIEKFVRSKLRVNNNKQIKTLKKSYRKNRTKSHKQSMFSFLF